MALLGRTRFHMADKRRVVTRGARLTRALPRLLDQVDRATRLCALDRPEEGPQKSECERRCDPSARTPLVHAAVARTDRADAEHRDLELLKYLWNAAPPE